MFDVGFWELVLIMMVALLVVGPERLPELAHTLGLWINRARRIVGEVRGEVERELRVEEVKRAMQQQGAELDEMKKLADRVKAINADVKTAVTSALKEPVLPPAGAAASVNPPPAAPAADSPTTSPVK
jgi:sec-independent protein translocase protein TatB